MRKAAHVELIDFGDIVTELFDELVEYDGPWVIVVSAFIIRRFPPTADGPRLQERNIFLGSFYATIELNVVRETLQRAYPGFPFVVNRLPTELCPPAMRPNNAVFDFARPPPGLAMEQVAGGHAKEIVEECSAEQVAGGHAEPPSSGSGECGVVDGAHAEEIVEEPSKCEKPKMKFLKNVKWAPRRSSEDCLAKSDV